MTDVKSIADLSQSEVERILDIVDRLNDIEVHLELGDMKLHVRKFSDASMIMAGNAAPPAAAPVARAPAPAAAVQAPAPAGPAGGSGTSLAVEPASASPGPQQGLVDIRAPMLGRFYRASSPSEPAYVEVGSKVREEDTVCMIEVMKLFNSVSAGVSGEVVEIVAQNGEMVEHDAVLLRVRPE